MDQVVVVGAGWAGCAAALQAVKEGAQTVLLERTDMLLGTGLVGGIMRNNGRFTASEELIAMGGGELIQLCDQYACHANIDFPGHQHATLYDVGKIPIAVERLLIEKGVKIHYLFRVDKVKMEQNSIQSVYSEKGEEIKGEVFVDTTGTAGPMKNCSQYGNGCAMCVYRCPSFGARVSIAGLAGVKEKMGERKDGTPGVMSGSCKLYKESLSEDIQVQLNEKGVAMIPIPSSIQKKVDLSQKACQQYALQEFADNIILLDNGHAKMMTSWFPLQELRKIPGFEQVRFSDPYAGGIGNSIRFMNIAPRDHALQVQGVDNLFCAGEKAGTLVGHTEAICTGVLAGYNSVQLLKGLHKRILPETICIGDMISFSSREMDMSIGLRSKYTFSGAIYFDRMVENGLYSIDVDEIKNRITRAELAGIFSKQSDR